MLCNSGLDRWKVIPQKIRESLVTVNLTTKSCWMHNPLIKNKRWNRIYIVLSKKPNNYKAKEFNFIIKIHLKRPSNTLKERWVSKKESKARIHSTALPLSKTLVRCIKNRENWSKLFHSLTGQKRSTKKLEPPNLKTMSVHFNSLAAFILDWINRKNPLN
jgi:hypothetical protein